MARKHIDRLGREFRGEGVGPASKLTFDPAGTGLAATTVQAAIAEVNAAIPAPVAAGGTFTLVATTSAGVASYLFAGAPNRKPIFVSTLNGDVAFADTDGNGTVESAVRLYDKVGAFQYSKAFAFVNGGISLECSAAVPGEFEYWFNAPVTLKLIAHF